MFEGAVAAGSAGAVAAGSAEAGARTAVTGTAEADGGWDAGLDDAQLAATTHGDTPLVIVAGAGTGKTRTLTARVAHLLERGVAPDRILLLTFTRRAADDMLARAAALARLPGPPRAGASGRLWGGTFHAVAHRFIATHAQSLGLPSRFSVLDQSDAGDVMDLLREEAGLAPAPTPGAAPGAAPGARSGREGLWPPNAPASPDRPAVRLPRPATLVDVYSRCVNTSRPLREVLAEDFPWVEPHVEALGHLFRAYGARKRAHCLLDFDDLLLYWRALLADPVVGPGLAGRFDHVLVDEYQDVNSLQAEIVTRLCPGGRGLTVVGDDAQAIYGFRGGDPAHLHRVTVALPGATVIRLERNFRSRQRLLDLANAVRPSAHGHRLTLRSSRGGGARPRLLHCHDAPAEARAVADAVLARAEAGMRLNEQAVLMRAAHHSDLLELELTARRVPYVKYGGLRFLEAAHVKDFVAAARLLDNPADEVAWFRLLRLHEGIGPARARRLLAELAPGEGAAMSRTAEAVAAAPPAARTSLSATMTGLAAAREAAGAASRADAVLRTLRPLLVERYPDATVRLGDLERLVSAAAGLPDLAALLVEVTLDPPASTSDLAGPPHLDEDYLVLSTVHSAKGLEWRAVYVIHLIDGAFPSDMALGSPEGLDEERRLFYVAVTRARDELTLCTPLRMPHRRRSLDDRHSYAAASRFLDEAARATLDVGEDPLPRPRDEPAPARRVALPDLDELWH